jgi:hypothetical protein
MTPHEQAMERGLRAFLARYAVERQISGRQAVTLAAEALVRISRKLHPNACTCIFTAGEPCPVHGRERR